MKVCSKCKIKKDELEFVKSSRRADGIGSWCKECQRLACKNYYTNNKQVFVQKSMKRHKDKRDTIGKLLLEYKSKPCADCGKVFHPVAMDFDHVGENKRSEVSTLARQGYSLETIREEIKKCDVVCACCHRVRTFNRLSSKPRPYSMYPELLGLGDSGVIFE